MECKIDVESISSAIGLLDAKTRGGRADGSYMVKTIVCVGGNTF